MFNVCERSYFAARQTSLIVIYEFEEGAQLFEVEYFMCFYRLYIAFKRTLISLRIFVRNILRGNYST